MSGPSSTPPQSLPPAVPVAPAGAAMPPAAADAMVSQSAAPPAAADAMASQVKGAGQWAAPPPGYPAQPGQPYPYAQAPQDGFPPTPGYYGQPQPGQPYPGQAYPGGYPPAGPPGVVYVDPAQAAQAHERSKDNTAMMVGLVLLVAGLFIPLCWLVGAFVPLCISKGRNAKIIAAINAAAFIITVIVIAVVVATRS